MRSLFVLIVLIFTLSSCSDNIVYFKPLMYTDEPQDIYANSAKLGGEVLSEGGTDISEYGIVYGVNYPPTINDNKVVVGSRVARFSDVFNNFLPGTTYYYTAFGTNAEGTGYGEVYEFTTMVEAPCNPQENYIDVTTNYVSPQDGPFTEISIVNEYNQFGSDFIIRAKKGYWSQPEILDVHFQGNPEDLYSGVYFTTPFDLDSSYANENSVKVTYKHHNKLFISEDDIPVYVEKNGSYITITLCNVDFNGTINSSEINVNVNTKFTVN